MLYNNFHRQIVESLNDTDIKIVYIDLFCGAGGTSTGVNRSKYGKVIACVNHDKNAIASHAANHSNALHFIEDIRTINLNPIVKLVDLIRSTHPHLKISLWASLECTNFSKAKGGKPRDADSRTLAEHLYRYIEVLNPDYIQIENVVEFMSWGPLDDNGKPVSRKSGADWLKWREHICFYGYNDDWRELNAADFGAYTSRNRLFGIFAKTGLPITWPNPTHSKKDQVVNLFGDSLRKWRPVRECLDFSNKGTSIFGRKKPLVNATLERLYEGLLKFVAKGDDSFMTKYNSNQANGKVFPGVSLDIPCHTIAVQQRLALTTVDKAESSDSVFLMKYHGNGENLIHSQSPCSTLTTKDRVAPVFIDRPFTMKFGQHVSVDGPMGTLTTVPKANLVECEHFLMNPQYASKGSSIDAPSFTLIARMDKAPPYLITTEQGQSVIIVYDNDPEPMKKIKYLMAHFGLIDIKMRMLTVVELLRIQGFGENYTLIGTQVEQKKYIGNSVVPQVVSAWVDSLGQLLHQN